MRHNTAVDSIIADLGKHDAHRSIASLPTGLRILLPGTLLILVLSLIVEDGVLVQLILATIAVGHVEGKLVAVSVLMRITV